MSQSSPPDGNDGDSICRGDDEELNLMKIVAHRASDTVRSPPDLDAEAHPVERPTLAQNESISGGYLPSVAIADRDRKSKRRLSFFADRRRSSGGHEKRKLATSASPIPIASPPRPSTSQPGAYSDAPGQELHRLETAQYDMLGSERVDSQRSGDNTAAVSTRDRPLATNESLPSTEGNEIEESTPRKSTLVAGIICLGLALVVALVLMAVVLLSSGPSKEQGFRAKTNQNIAGDNFLASFPAYTLQALEKSNSPQSKAYEWLLNDSKFLEGSYPMPRILQRYALATFYYASGAGSWGEDRGWLDYSNECKWFGISCGQQKSSLEGIADVNRIALNDNLLRGELPLEVFWLSNLASLELKNNRLSGTLATEFGLLTGLERLFLASNNVVGPIPSELGGITELHVEDNQLNGSLPLALLNGNGTHVALSLRIDGTDILDQALPTEIGHLSNLIVLNVSGIGGSIPTEVGGLTTLKEIHFGNGTLVGTIPSQLGLLQELTVVRFKRNELIGSLPSELGNLRELHELTFQYNFLTGHLPSELGGLGQLIELHLTRNLLSGSIPKELCSLVRLERMRLDWNDLIGTIPSEVGHLQQNLLQLDLDGNELTGSFPSQLGNLKRLVELSLKGNDFSGTLPTELGKLKQLEKVLMRGHLWRLGRGKEGGIPSELGKLENLEELDLSKNIHSGSIPTQLCVLRNLKVLNLGNNGLRGALPSQIGSLQSLVELTLDQNNLTGPIPSQVGSLQNLIYLNLGNNNLTGTVPTEIGNLTNLVQFDFNEN